MCIRDRDVRKALSVLAAEYYGHPADRLTLIGLTGTKGKTTTTSVSYTHLDVYKRQVAVSVLITLIGTVFFSRITLPEVSSTRV